MGGVAPDTLACAILKAHRHPLEGLNSEALAVLRFGERSWILRRTFDWKRSGALPQMGKRRC